MDNQIPEIIRCSRKKIILNVFNRKKGPFNREERAMKKRFLILAVLGLMIHGAGFASAADAGSDQGPWEKFNLNVGAFLSSTDSSLRIGTGVGIDLDMEELLGLDTTSTVFRVDGYWRFSDNRRHRADFTWFAFRRDGTNEIGEDFNLELPDGDIVEIAAGTKIKSNFDLDIFQAAYSYSFIQDDRLDLAAMVGFYVMPIDFGLEVTGLVDKEGQQNFTAPLPVVGLRVDVAIAPKWYFRSGAQVFYLEYEQFTGSLIETRAAVEYNPWQHVGVGLGLDVLRFNLDADGEDYPSIDLVGSVEFNYTGLQLYMRFFF
jgi:hypothetical protein